MIFALYTKVSLLRESYNLFQILFVSFTSWFSPCFD